MQEIALRVDVRNELKGESADEKQNQNRNHYRESLSMKRLG